MSVNTIHQTKRIILVDDHDSVRHSLTYLLKLMPQIQIVGEAKTGLEAVQVCQATRPDIVVMDINMPQINGFDSIRIINKQCPDIQFIVLSSFSHKVPADLASCQTMTLLGKDASVDEILSAINQALAV